MKLKFTLAAAILAFGPSFANAMGCERGHGDQQAMSCAEGLVWDADKGSCVEQATS